MGSLLALIVLGCLFLFGIAPVMADSFSESVNLSELSSTNSTSSQSSSRTTFSVDLNGDGRPDRCETTNASRNSRRSGRTTCYLTLPDGREQKIFDLPYPVSSFYVPGRRTNGWADIVTQTDAAFPPHMWRWNGHAYQ